MLETDASHMEIGMVLLQEHGGRERPVAFFSKKLTATERNYDTTDRELLAML